MSFESGNAFGTSENFAELFAKMYEDKTLSPEELEQLNEAKSAFEQEIHSATLTSTQDRAVLSYNIEATEDLPEGTSDSFGFGNTMKYKSENEVLNVLKKHPTYIADKEVYSALTKSQRRAIQASSFENPSQSDLDGVFGVNTFTAFRNSSLFERGMSIEEVAGYFESIKTEFNKLSGRARKEYQKEGSQDGVYGPNTFAHIIKEGKDFEILGVEVTTAVEVVTSGSADDLPDVSDFIEAPAPVYNNGLEVSDEEFAEMKEKAREEGTNPSYQEFRVAVRDLSTAEKEHFQRAVNARVDGRPGLGSYTHFIHSKVYEAGFSIEEITTLKTITAEDTESQVRQINEAFNIDLNELPAGVGQNDMVSYEPNYGILTVVDHESGIRSDVDVAEGLFDTIEGTFELEEGEELDREKIFTTLDQMRGKTDLQREYITALKDYIHENNAYAQVREILCVPGSEETETGIIYTVDFRDNRVLSNMMVAQDIFGDIPYLKTADTTFINRQQPERDFKTFNGSQRLSVRSGTSVLVPNATEEAKIQESMDLLEREQEIREKIEERLSETITSEDKVAILEYLEIDTISEREKNTMISKLKEEVYKQKLFVNVRNMFTTEESGVFTFSPGNDFLGEKLTAFDLFGDYKTLTSEETNFHSIREKNYTNAGSRLVLIAGETQIEPKAESLRTEADYETLREGAHPEYAQGLGRYLQTVRVGTADGNCARGVADLLMGRGRYSPLSRLEYGVQVDRSDAKNWDNLLDARVATGQFQKVKINHPSEAKAGGIICYNEGARRGSRARKRFGHVEVCDGRGNYLYDGKTNTPAGSCYNNAANDIERNIIAGRTSDPDRFKRLTAFTGYVYYPTRRA